MAKGFHYFKFIATEWLAGDIVYEDYELQGIFINVCAIYWHRDGKVSFEEIEKRLKSKRLAELTDRFISVSNGFISIKFLDEQLIEANHVSKTNSENGKKGGRPKAAPTLQEKPTANRPLTDRKANESQIELNKSKVEVNKLLGDKHFNHINEFYSEPYESKLESFRKTFTKSEYDSFKKFIDALFRDFSIEQLVSQWDKCLNIGDWKKHLQAKPYMILKPAIEKSLSSKEANRNEMALRIKTFTNGLLDEKVFVR